ncbi:MAG: hypothetical protein ACREI4_09725, partial [Candidatus Rokuibacteriota bacterium]
LVWTARPEWDDWARHSEGGYVLRISDPISLDTGLTIMTVTKEVDDERERPEGKVGGIPGRGGAARRAR